MYTRLHIFICNSSTLCTFLMPERTMRQNSTLDRSPQMHCHYRLKPKRSRTKPKKQLSHQITSSCFLQTLGCGLEETSSSSLNMLVPLTLLQKRENEMSLRRSRLHNKIAIYTRMFYLIYEVSLSAVTHSERSECGGRRSIRSGQKLMTGGGGSV